MLKIYICVGSSCYMKGSHCVTKTFKELIERYDLSDQVELKASFCLGHCTKGVSAKVGNTFIEDLLPENAEERFEEFVLNRLMVRV